MKRTRLILLGIVLVIYGILFLSFGGEVTAAPITFDFTFFHEDPVSEVSATGFLTVESERFPNPTLNTDVPEQIPTSDPAILDLSITISGAFCGNGDGTYGRGDFEFLIWGTGGDILDFTKELVGQPTRVEGETWGDPDSWWHGADFNLRAPFSARGYSPNGVSTFRFSPYPYVDPQTPEPYWSEVMVLTSFKPRSQPVPEPATMLLLGSGLIGLAGYWRKKFFRK